jgi:tRNA1(Val) A37 N6-methylase TrmN6
LSSGIASATTEDDLLGGALRLRQPARGYRLTSDAVLLAALTPVRPGQRVLELGTGYGQVALCLLAREPSLHVTGLELMPQAAQLARENAQLNSLADRFMVVEGNVADCQLGGFDVVVTNPPYRQASTHTASGDAIKAAATTESIPLATWIAAAARALDPAGQLLVIHDARRAPELVEAAIASGLQAIELLPLVSKPGQASLRVVLRARGQGACYRELEPLILHEHDGSWVPAVERVLRAPHALTLWPD